MNDIEFKLKCIDEASGAVADASKRITASLDEISDSESRVAQSVEDTVAPLSNSERGQLENAGTALQLKTAEQDLKDAQDNLNGAIRGYGTNSKEAASALRDLNSAQSNVASLQAQVGETTQQSTVSMKSFATGLSGAATASFSLYSAYDRIEQVEIRVDRANLMVHSSTKAVEDAQRALSEAVSKYGANSDESRAATERYSIAQERLAVSNDQAEQAQQNVSQAIMASALQIIPTSITMVDSLSKAWKNFPDISSLLTKISTRVADVGISAKTAAIGVAAFMGGFLIADSILGSLPENIRQIAGALTASIAAIVAATIAWMAFNGTMTVGVAVPIILAAVGVGIAGVKAAVAMAEGGVIDRPTLILAGEAGAEIVEPLSRYESRKALESPIASSQVPQQIIPVTITLNVFEEADYEKAKEKVLEGISEAYARQRGT